MVKNKRGLQLVMNTAVVMILAIVVLLVLVGFFMLGSEDFMDKIGGYFSYSNVDSVVSGCNVLVDSGQSSSFCCDVKEVKYVEGGEKKEGKFSCSELVDKGFVNGLKKISCPGDCSGLNEQSCNENGRWNECGNKCEIMNLGEGFCVTVCEEICECGTIAGLSCPSGYKCKSPEGIADALGYCEVIG